MSPEQAARWVRCSKRVPPDNVEAVAYVLGTHAKITVLSNTSFRIEVVRHHATHGTAYVKQDLHGETLDRVVNEAEAIVQDMGWPCPWANDANPAETD